MMQKLLMLCAQLLRALQGRRQHGTIKRAIPPPPDFSAAPSTDGFCPDHGHSLAMKQLPLKVYYYASLTHQSHYAD